MNVGKACWMTEYWFYFIMQYRFPLFCARILVCFFFSNLRMCCFIGVLVCVSFSAKLKLLV